MCVQSCDRVATHVRGGSTAAKATSSLIFVYSYSPPRLSCSQDDNNVVRINFQSLETSVRTKVGLVYSLWPHAWRPPALLLTQRRHSPFSNNNRPFSA